MLRARLELGKDCTFFETITQALQIFFKYPLANNATVLIFKVKGELMTDEMTVEVIFMWVAGVCTLGGPLLLALAT
jgi:hypothetical protein